MTPFSRAHRILIPGLVLALPLAFNLTLNDTFDLPKLCLVYTAIAILLPWLFWEFKNRTDRPLIFTHAEGTLVCFLAVAALSTYGSIDRSISLLGLYRVHVFGLIPMCAFALLFWLSAQEDDACRMALALMLGGALAGIYALFQYEGFEIFQSMPHIEGGRPWGSLGNPIYLGAVCMMAFVVTVGELNAPRYDQWFLGALMVGQSAGLLLSLSRSAWVGACVGVLFLGALQKRKKLLGVAGLFILGSLALLPAVRQRAGLLFSRDEGSNAARIEGWKGALAVWQEYPVIGSGPDTFFEAFRPHRSLTYIRVSGPELTQAHAHNDFLQIVATLGALGFSFFLILLILFSRYSLAVCRANPSSPTVPLAAACLALFMQDQFNFSSVTTTAWAAILLGQIMRFPDSVNGSFLKKRFTRFVLFGMAAGMGGLFFALGLRSWTADAADKRGQALSQGGQSVLALVEFRESVRWRPEVELYQTDLGNAARTLAQLAAPGSLRTDLFQEAQTAALANTQRHPQDPDAWNNLGVVAMWRNQLNQEATMADAQKAFQQAVALDPFFVDGWANLAKWHHLQGDIPGEKRLWRKVLAINPQQAMARAVLAQ